MDHPNLDDPIWQEDNHDRPVSSYSTSTEPVQPADSRLPISNPNTRAYAPAGSLGCTDTQKYSPTSPSYSPTSPPCMCPNADLAGSAQPPRYANTSPHYSPTTPAYSPTSPSFVSNYPNHDLATRPLAPFCICSNSWNFTTPTYPTASPPIMCAGPNQTLAGPAVGPYSVGQYAPRTPVLSTRTDNPWPPSHLQSVCGGPYRTEDQNHPDNLVNPWTFGRVYQNWRRDVSVNGDPFNQASPPR